MKPDICSIPTYRKIELNPLIFRRRGRGHAAPVLRDIVQVSHPRASHPKTMHQDPSKPVSSNQSMSLSLSLFLLLYALARSRALRRKLCAKIILYYIEKQSFSLSLSLTLTLFR